MATAIAGADAGREPVRRAQRHRGEGRDQRAPRRSTPPRASCPPRPTTPARCGDVERIRAHLATATPADYVALLRLLPAHARARRAAHPPARRLPRPHAATRRPSGYGPRFLHSTGQLHKGGPNTGVFLQLTADAPADLPVPGESYTFATLRDAQALGDLQVLQAPRPARAPRPPGRRHRRRRSRRWSTRSPAKRRAAPANRLGRCSKTRQSPSSPPVLPNPLREGLAEERIPEPAAMVIFGASGDLAHRKLLPALYSLTRDRLLPARFAIVGFARRAVSDDAFREEMRAALQRVRAPPPDRSRAVVRVRAQHLLPAGRVRRSRRRSWRSSSGSRRSNGRWACPATASSIWRRRPRRSRR